MAPAAADIGLDGLWIGSSVHETLGRMANPDELLTLMPFAATTGTATANSSTTLLRAVRGCSVTATGRPLHIGRTAMVVQTDVTDDAGRPVAQTTRSQAVLRSA